MSELPTRNELDEALINHLLDGPLNVENGHHKCGAVMGEAARRIESLRAELERERENRPTRKQVFGSLFKGCTDGNCVVLGKRPGAHTNGGCKCLVNASRSQLMALTCKLQALLSTHPEGNSDE